MHLRLSLAFTFTFVGAIACVGVLVHCSSGGGGPLAGHAPDGSGSDARGNDEDARVGEGGPRAPRCDPKKPFGTPIMVLENSFRVDQSARLSPDELTLYYAGYGNNDINGQAELWVATRTSTTVAFK